MVAESLYPVSAPGDSLSLCESTIDPRQGCSAYKVKHFVEKFRHKSKSKLPSHFHELPKYGTQLLRVEFLTQIVQVAESDRGVVHGDLFRQQPSTASRRPARTT